MYNDKSSLTLTGYYGAVGHLFRLPSVVQYFAPCIVTEVLTRLTNGLIRDKANKLDTYCTLRELAYCPV
jgi:hypothetical protein